MKKTMLCILLAALLLLSGCGKELSQPPLQEGQKQYKATYLDLFDTVTVMLGYAQSEQAFQKQVDAVAEELREYHQLFDIYQSYDGINNLKTVNDHAGIEPVEVDERILALLSDCKDWYEVSDGAVNVAMGSVLSLWHTAREDALRDPTAAYLPSKEALEDAKQHTDFSAVILDQEAKTVYLADPKQRLDVGAVAKGWAVEQVCKNAPAHMVISVGGNVKATGPKQDGSPWVIGVQDPAQKDGNYLKLLNITDQSAVTSGDYQRFYTVAGENYHHIIDPKTAHPSEHFRAVTVVCDDSGAADALSTALFVLPMEEGEALLEAFDAQALWVKQNGEVICSEGMTALCRE